MKKLIFAIAVFAFTFSNVYAKSEKTVPEKVKSAFNDKFSNPTDVKWDMENKKEWEAEFKLNGKEYSANFDLDGVWLETEYKVTEAQIPATIKSSLMKIYSGCSIQDVEVSETPKAKVYEIMILNGNKKMEVSFDESGKEIKD